MTIFAALAAVSGGFCIYLFRPGGLYNPKDPMKPETTTQKIYDLAVQYLGKELYDLMTPSVPAQDGCAASVSYILSQAGLPIPMGGILTVNGLIDWLLKNGKEVPAVEIVPGTIVTAHMPDVTDPQWAHTVIRGLYGDIGNTSFPIAGFKAGEWAENYHGDNFEKSFQKHGCIIRYFNVI